MSQTLLTEFLIALFQLSKPAKISRHLLQEAFAPSLEGKLYLVKQGADKSIPS
jgi:hypothetical protein